MSRRDIPDGSFLFLRFILSLSGIVTDVFQELD